MKLQLFREFLQICKEFNLPSAQCGDFSVVMPIAAEGLGYEEAMTSPSPENAYESLFKDSGMPKFNGED